jgi:threonyl-tRNA synthetase
MERIIDEDQPFISSSKEANDAIKDLNNSEQPFKVEYAIELHAEGEALLSFYQNGPFIDMCAGPHVPSTGFIPKRSFLVDSLAGAYWRGDETKPQLTRLYCLAFSNEVELTEYLEMRKMAEERDHRKLGKSLGLFSIRHEEIGGGLVLWHPKGALIRHLIEEHLKKLHLKGGYDFVYTPHIGRSSLWETSGHLSFFKEGMFAPLQIDGQEYYLKPMNCPFHCHIYKGELYSYRDLPLRFAEWGTVYRFERSGTLHGLSRVRGFTQDDAHIFCRLDQIESEIDRVLTFSLDIFRLFTFQKFHLFLSTRPKERVGEDSMWERAENSLRSALERSGLPYSVKEGDGAFYGPKIDICVKDSLNREWQLSTIQFDFNLPERFDLSYVGQDGGRHRPFMVHRALLGSMERFFGILIEHLGGVFPLWLAPVQIALVCVKDTLLDKASAIKDTLVDQGLRATIDNSTGSFNKRLKEAITSKIPVIGIIGERDLNEGLITLRWYGEENQEQVKIGDLSSHLRSKAGHGPE